MNSNNNQTNKTSKDSPSGGSMNNNRMDSYFFQLFSNHILDGNDGGSSGGAPPNGSSTATTTTTTTTTPTTTHATDEQAQKWSTPPPNQNTLQPRLQPTTTTTTASTSTLFQDSDDDEDDEDDANDAEKLRLLNEIEQLRRSNHELEEEIMIFRDDVMFQFDDADVSAVGQEQDEQGNQKTWIGFIAADSNDQLLLMTDHLREQLGVDKLRVRDYHWGDLMQPLSTTADKSDSHSSSSTHDHDSSRSRHSPHLNTTINWDQLSVFPLHNHLNNNSANNTNYDYSRLKNGGSNSFCYLGAFPLRHLNSENNRASIVQCKKAIRRMTYSNTMSGSPQQSNNHNTTSPPLCYSMTKLYYLTSR